MNIKTFTIIAIASFAVLSVTACGGKQKASIETEQTEETSKTEVIVSDNKLFINSDLYNMSEEKVIFNAHGRLDPDNPSFGTDHIDHYLHIPADTRSAFPVISVQSPVSIQCCWQS